eukprot:TRINITY_DN6409_c0_g1_i2.p1 TRINITY_DN6409_c0_g1~~TRINITY_DN6409_c0_g1_i2.p1  ORF type:complete len:153 (-),score=19.99 TRINITY_DN6409_c0_g1_i2:49-507(-)
MRTKKIYQDGNPQSQSPTLKYHTEPRLVGMRQGHEGFVDVISCVDLPDTVTIPQRAELNQRHSWNGMVKGVESFLVSCAKRFLGRYLMSGEKEDYEEVLGCANDMTEYECSEFASFLLGLDTDLNARDHFSEEQLFILRQTEYYFRSCTVHK